MVRVIGHAGLLRVFSFARPIRVLGMSRGSSPRHAQTAGDLGFAGDMVLHLINYYLGIMLINSI